MNDNASFSNCQLLRLTKQRNVSNVYRVTKSVRITSMLRQKQPIWVVMSARLLRVPPATGFSASVSIATSRKVAGRQLYGYQNRAPCSNRPNYPKSGPGASGPSTPSPWATFEAGASRPEPATVSWLRRIVVGRPPSVWCPARLLWQRRNREGRRSLWCAWGS